MSENNINDMQFKKYSLQVEKALLVFDTINEWPDIITFLAKLSKALNSYDIDTLPCLFLLSKRINQCFNPSLPSGVHQKALEVLDVILNKVKVNL